MYLEIQSLQFEQLHVYINLKRLKLNIHVLDLQAVTVSPNKMTKKEMTKDLEFMAKEIRTRVFINNVINFNHHDFYQQNLVKMLFLEYIWTRRA